MQCKGTLKKKQTQKPKKNQTEAPSPALHKVELLQKKCTPH